MAESTKKDKEKASGEEKLSKKETAFLESKARGNDAVSAGQWASAIEAYTEAIKSGPSTYFELNGPGAAVLSNRSLAYLKSGNFDKALQDASDCISLRPDWSKSHFRRGDVYRHLGHWRQAEAHFRVAFSKDPYDTQLRDLVSEAAAKAKLSDMPQEVLLGVEERLGLTVETVWPARCGLAGFLICFGLAISQPPGSTNNAIFHAMLALAGLGLGSGAGLAVRMLRASKRRELLAPPEIPKQRRAQNGGARSSECAEDEDEDERGGGDGVGSEEARRKRVKGLSKSLRNRAGR